MEKWELSSGFGFCNVPQDNVDEYFRSNLEFHRKFGFASVNFGFRQLDLMAQNLEVHMERAQRVCEETGVRFGVAHLPFVSQKSGLPEGDAFAEWMHRCIDGFKLAGVDYAVVHPNSTTLPLSEYDPKAEYDNVLGHLAPFVEHANRVGLNIVIENMRVVHQSYPVHRFGADPEELCKIADELGIGICWDTGHAHIAGLGQSEAITYVGKRLKMLHLNDNFAGDDIHLVPFVGDIDWQDVVNGLLAIGYEGYLNFEVGFRKLTPEMRPVQGALTAAAGKALQRMLAETKNEER